MILLRKPFVVLDVDAAGVGVLALLVGVAWWGIATPLFDTATQCAMTRATMKAAEDARRDARSNLKALAQDTAGLEALLSEFKDSVPTESQRSNVVADIVARATAGGVQVVSVTPLQPIRGERHVSVDTDLKLRCTPAALTELLEQLAAEFPYHSIEDITVTGDRASDDESCEANLRLRLYMLGDAPESRREAAAANAGAKS